MATLLRYRVSWTGGPVVGPGVSTFYFSGVDSQLNAAALNTFYDGVKAIVPVGVQWVIPSSGDTVDDTTSEINGAWSYTPPVAAVNSSGAAGFTNGTGARVKWRTAGIRHGRRVVGSTFIVPLASTQFEGAGNILSTALTTMQTAANNLLAAAPTLRILSRPLNPGDGISSVVISAQVPDFVSWLRSRRT